MSRSPTPAPPASCRPLRPFCSFLQAEVDGLASDAGRVRGGLLVLGSLHTEMMAILEDRSAPLFNRTTDEMALTHLDVASLKALLREHADLAPERLLFLWTLFEGVPKFYRDGCEQGVLNQDRRALLRRIFFESSSPLRTAAENWFLKELRGQYDVVLKFVARHAGCLHNELMGEIQQFSGESSQQGGRRRVQRPPSSCPRRSTPRKPRRCVNDSRPSRPGGPVTPGAWPASCRKCGPGWGSRR